MSVREFGMAEVDAFLWMHAWKTVQLAFEGTLLALGSLLLSSLAAYVVRSRFPLLAPAALGALTSWTGMYWSWSKGVIREQNHFSAALSLVVTIPFFFILGWTTVGMYKMFKWLEPTRLENDALQRTSDARESRVQLRSTAEAA